MLPAGWEPLWDAEAMRALDAWAIGEAGIAGLDLMERAGAGLAELVAERGPQGEIAVVCGAGNNGGDGYVAARLLRQQGRSVRVVTSADPDRLRGDARINAERLPGDGPVPLSGGALDGVSVVVDAVLGTGSHGPPRDGAAAAIAAINAAAVPVVAADVPSGVDASTGEVPGDAVRAIATASFAAAMPGLWIHPGKAHAGEVVVVDIGVPARGFAAIAAPTIGLIGGDVLAGYPRRGPSSTKFASGHVLVVGGSRGLTGAPCLTAAGAQRAGAGYVTVCIPATLHDVFAVKLTEAMTLSLPAADGGHSAAGADAVLDRARQRGGALVVGPGLGRADGAAALVHRLADEAPVSLVLDADGLNAIARAPGGLERLRDRPAPTVLTPHAGELARLLDAEPGAVGAQRLQRVTEAARRSGAIVVLKGDDTLVAEPHGRVGVSRGASPALATAGTGDVLAGVVAALLARGMDPFSGACAAVAVHAAAGRHAAEAVGGSDGVIASDVVEQLPRALG
jgi:NAD(P)H-hydrate epimerase